MYKCKNKKINFQNKKIYINNDLHIFRNKYITKKWKKGNIIIFFL